MAGPGASDSRKSWSGVGDATSDSNRRTRSRNTRWLPTKSMTRALLALAAAQAAPELLEEHHGRLGRPQHHHPIDRRDVDALVEHVHRAEGVQLASPELRPGIARDRRSRGRRTPPRRERLAPQASADKRACSIEQQNTSVRDARVLAPGPPQRSMRRCVCTAAASAARIEAPVAPGDLGVVDVVADAEVAERHQLLPLDASAEVRPVGDEVVEQPEDVALVGAVRRRGQPQQEGRVAGGRGSAGRRARPRGGPRRRRRSRSGSRRAAPGARARELLDRARPPWRPRAASALPRTIRCPPAVPRRPAMRRKVAAAWPAAPAGGPGTARAASVPVSRQSRSQSNAASQVLPSPSPAPPARAAVPARARRQRGERLLLDVVRSGRWLERLGLDLAGRQRPAVQPGPLARRHRSTSAVSGRRRRPERLEGARARAA